LPCVVAILDVETGKLERSLTFPPSAIIEKGGLVPDGARSIAVSSDSRWLALGARSGAVHVWDLKAPGDGPAFSWNTPRSPLARPFFAKDNTLVSYITDPRLVQSWRLGAGAPVEAARLAASPGRLGIDLSPGGDLLACLAGDRVLFLDPQTLKPVH